MRHAVRRHPQRAKNADRADAKARAIAAVDRMWTGGIWTDSTARRLGLRPRKPPKIAIAPTPGIAARVALAEDIRKGAWAA
jgi:hypothetical protein